MQLRLVLSSLLAACLWPTWASAQLTFFSYSDTHYGADHGGKRPPVVRSSMVEVINKLPGTAYPSGLGGVVEEPRGILMAGDLINDGAIRGKALGQWRNYVADFGVHGEGRCRFPVFEGVGNHDLHPEMFVFSQVKERNVVRERLGLIDHVSPNGYHYSWDWDGVHFVNVNLFPGNVGEGEADAYGRAHHPRYARDFLVEDLARHVGSTGRPVIIMQHYRPIDQNWWTVSAADKFRRILQDYNVVAIMVGHQGGLVGNAWRGYDWISSNGDLIVCRIQDGVFTAIHRRSDGWGRMMQKKIFRSYADSGLPAVVSNGDWAAKVTATSVTLTGKIVHQAASPTELTFYWGTSDGGDDAAAWQHSRKLGAQESGVVAAAAIDGLDPWTEYYYRAAASNHQGVAWAVDSVSFRTSGLLPEGWQEHYVGHAQRSGNGAHSVDGVFMVRGSGRDIGEGREPIDNFQFVYQALTGDGEIVARVAGSQVRSREPKVGVMLRESVADGARNVALLIDARKGPRLSWRGEEHGGNRKMEARGMKIAVPCWLKLARQGDHFTGLVSQDGMAWKQVGEPITVPMNAGLLGGLAVTAGCRDESKVHAASFDRVSINGANSKP